MVVYWGILIGVVLVGWCQSEERNPLKSNDAEAYQASWGVMIALMLPVIFFAAVRGNVMDTGAYHHIFKSIPMDMSKFDAWLDTRKGSLLYYGLEYYFKNYISDQSYMWMGLMSIIQGVAITVMFKKHTVDAGMSVYIFIASTMFTWMLNGARQFLVVTILFAMSDWIIKNKWYFYMPILMLLAGVSPLCEIFGWPEPPWYLGGIHQSAYMMIPFFFAVQGKAWNRKMWMFIVVFVGLLLTGGLDPLLESSSEVSEFSGNITSMQEDSGASPIRAIVALVPVAMAFMKREEIEKMGEKAPPFIHLCINMSVVSLAMYVASVFTSGIFVGRLAIYAEIYGLILIPWLIMVPYKKDKHILSVGVYGAYLLWFIYQMYIPWAGLPYASDVLKLYIW